MLIYHSNQLGFHKNSLVPINQAQFSRAIYDMDSTQYNKLNFSAYLNAFGAKTAVPKTKSVPVSVDKSCPTNDSLDYPGGNGKGISHSRISASDDAEDQRVIDARKQRRLLSNRESARRCRLRKQLHLGELSAEVAQMKAENEQIQDKFCIASRRYVQITKENCLLRSEALELSQKLQILHHTINAQSHSAFKTTSIETGNCSAAHLNSESGTIAHSFMSSGLLF